MNIVHEHQEFGHLFQIEQLEAPLQRGASLRNFRLWDNGHPAYGWQYHNNLESALSAAKYLLKNSYIQRIEYLELRVHELESRLYGGKAVA